jgi:hypothetical protein
VVGDLRPDVTYAPSVETNPAGFGASVAVTAGGDVVAVGIPDHSSAGSTIGGAILFN